MRSTSRLLVCGMSSASTTGLAGSWTSTMRSPAPPDMYARPSSIHSPSVEGESEELNLAEVTYSMWVARLGSMALAVAEEDAPACDGAGDDEHPARTAATRRTDRRTARIVRIDDGALFRRCGAVQVGRRPRRRFDQLLQGASLAEELHADGQLVQGRGRGEDRERAAEEAQAAEEA